MVLTGGLPLPAMTASTSPLGIQLRRAGLADRQVLDTATGAPVTHASDATQRRNSAGMAPGAPELHPSGPARDTTRGDPRCPPSRLGPDLDARHRRQDRRPHPARGRGRHQLPHPGRPRRLRRTRPVTRRSGSSIRGEHPPRGGNKHLKRAFLLAALAAPSDPNLPRPLRPQGPRHWFRSLDVCHSRCDSPLRTVLFLANISASDDPTWDLRMGCRTSPPRRCRSTGGTGTPKHDHRS